MGNQVSVRAEDRERTLKSLKMRETVGMDGKAPRGHHKGLEGAILRREKGEDSKPDRDVPRGAVMIQRHGCQGGL